MLAVDQILTTEARDEQHATSETRMRREIRMPEASCADTCARPVQVKTKTSNKEQTYVRLVVIAENHARGEVIERIMDTGVVM